MVQVCEPETGRNLIDEDELRSVEDLKDCQEGRIEVPNCQEGNEMRSLRDLIDCHEDSQGISHCQEGNESRSLRGLINCQEDSRKIPICQVGMGTEMRLCESLMNSEVSSYQQGMLVSRDSCGFADHVNEDDDKLKTCTIQEEDQGIF
jgi:hypothetical protein